MKSDEAKLTIKDDAFAGSISAASGQIKTSVIPSLCYAPTVHLGGSYCCRNVRRHNVLG
jgi:hypothetical protein